jgi:uroporphyrinogen-III decarboxylase
MYIYKFDNWNDNFYFDGNIYIWFSVVTEMSLFGTSIRFFKNREPWLEGKPLLANKKDLDMMETPDFFKSGLMPLVHKYYEVIRNEVDGKLPVIFPNLARGPFCYAAHLRGLDNILMDMISDPDFVHKLMRYMVNSEKNWIKERAKFLKVDKYPSGKLFNDEVGAPMMSPQLYEEFILPYEIELSQFQGGILYWHSCGIVEPTTTPFYELIKKIPNLKMMHISPWANDKKAAMVFKDEIALDKCLNPEQDVFSASKEEMEKRIRQIIEDYGEVPKYAIRFDAIEKMHGLEYDLKKIKEFVDIYNNIMGERG